MPIEPLCCPRCGRPGRPGEDGFEGGLDAPGVVTIHCICGEKSVLSGAAVRDQLVLSSNSFVRLIALSNFVATGEITVELGAVGVIKLERPLDHLCRVFLTAIGAPVAFKSDYRGGDEIDVFAGVHPGVTRPDGPVKASWLVYGLVDAQSLSTWFVHFYAATTHLENGLFKSSLLDYATAFEVFVEQLLTTALTSRFGADACSYMLGRANRLDERVKQLMKLAIGAALTEEPTVYQPWDRDVREPRNRLAHGEQVHLDREGALRAHVATYQAIRWLEDRAMTAGTGVAPAIPGA